MVHKHILLALVCFLLFFLKESKESEKLCGMYNRNLTGLWRLEPLSTWNLLSGYFCFLYYLHDGNILRQTNYTYMEIIDQNTEVIDINGSDYNVTWINKDEFKYFTYDYTNKTTRQYLNMSLQNELLFEKWKSCCIAAVSCCNETMTSDNVKPTKGYCPAVWDAWSCFPQTETDSTARVTCPPITYPFSKNQSCQLKSEKECLPDGSWNPVTNYLTCSIANVLRKRHTFHIAILAVSAILSFPSVIIFFSFRPLRQKTMLVLHRNLILIIVIRNLLTIMSKNMVILDAINNGEVMAQNGVPCRVLAFFENVAKNGIFACMFADGFYLHGSIVRPFADEIKLIFMYIMVFIFSLLPSLMWAVLRAVHDADSCWMDDTVGDYWVNDGFRLAILALNALLLLDIIRVMLMKLKQGGVSKQAKTTLKVTLVLFPLFGIQIIIMSSRKMIINETCEAHDAYYYTSFLMEGLQGVMVALLFCYMNSDVKKEFMNFIRKNFVYFQEKWGWCGSKKENYDKRRATTATYVTS